MSDAHTCIRLSVNAGGDVTVERDKDDVKDSDTDDDADDYETYCQYDDDHDDDGDDHNDDYDDDGGLGIMSMTTMLITMVAAVTMMMIML